ncbi:MAG: genomic island protein [Lysobacter sp.]|nr:genomic island protein [Lysobacter sp.]
MADSAANYSPGPIVTGREKSRFVYERYDEMIHRGHLDYCQHARRLEDFYLGGGRQWDPEVRQAREGEGRPCREVNQCLIAVNTAAGYQIANRVDIQFQPRGRGADDKTARCISKVMKQQLDNVGFKFQETQLFLDGLIQQRGYYDLRMSYDDNEQGELGLDVLDPLDVMPDPDARHYDPDRWADVVTTRWLTAMEIEQFYGAAAAREVIANASVYADQSNFGTEHGIRRDAFGTLPGGYTLGSCYYGDGLWRRYRILERQSNEYVNTTVGRWPGGDFRSIEDLPREHVAWLIDHGVVITKKRMRRVRWEVVAPELTLFDQLSPYEHFTVIPFFGYFRRGRTIGMLDNAVSPQEVLNKFISQFEHITNSVANSGWEGEADSLANMDDNEFVDRSAEPGLVLLAKPGKSAPKKMDPPKMPQGMLELIDLAHNNFRGVTGVDENLNGLGKSDLSGIAIQSRQFAAQQQLGLVLDGLRQTRMILARNALSNIQRFMIGERIFRICEVDEYGVEQHVEMPVNVPKDDGSGEYVNDLTIGEYNIVVNEAPMAVTFDNSHFEQITTMRKDLGVAIPDSVVLRYSTLPDKEEIAKAIAEAKGTPDPNAEANALLTQAKARLAKSQAVGEAIKAQYSAIQTAQAIVVTPQAAALADALLRSGGFEDQDAPPIVPDAGPNDLPAGTPIGQQLGRPAVPPGHPLLPPPEHNTHPLDPPNPEVGVARGLSDGPNNPPPRSA